MASDDGNTQQVQAGSDPTDRERRAIAWANDAVASRLPQIRSSAKDWQATVSTITGLFGAATVLNADSAVRQLLPAWGATYGVIVLLSLMCAGLALKLASQAAEPDRRVIPKNIDEQLQIYEEVFKLAARRLARSRILTIPAVGLLVLALAVRWYAPITATATAKGQADAAFSESVGSRPAAGGSEHSAAQGT